MDEKGNIILYTTPDGVSKIEVTLQNETVWLTLDQMAQLFQRNKSTISRHIKNIFEIGELNKELVVAFFATTTQHGAISGKTQTHIVEFYNQYDKFKERTAYELTPVEIHFLENFEKEQKQLMEKKKPVSN